MVDGPFVWGAGGAKLSPEQVKSYRDMAAALGAKRVASTPQNGWEGLSALANAFSERLWRDEAAKAESSGRDRAAALLSGINAQSDPNALIAALTSPDAEWLSPAQSSIGSALLSQGLERQDPRYQQGLTLGDLQIQQAQAELDALRNPPAPMPEYKFEGDQWWQLPPGGGMPTAVTAPPADDTTAIQNYQFLIRQGVDPAVAQQQAFGGSQTNVSVNTGANNDFFSGLSAAEGENFAGMLTAGNQASRNLEQISQLETLLKDTPQGLEGAATQFAANLGIDIGGAQGVQAAQALINQMVPAQRPPGSGPMSDADLDLYKQGIPRIINTPGGNELIIGTMRAINEYDRQLAAIVQEGISLAEMTDDPAKRAQIRREMRTRIDNLQNPVDSFRAAVANLPAPSGTPATPAGAPAPSAPQSQAVPGITDWTQL